MTVQLDTLTRRIKLSGYIETQTALHIGTGRSLGATGSDSPILLDVLGAPVIPGSSFKGTLRSQIEALVRGMESTGNRQIRCSNRQNFSRICDVISNQPCVPTADWDNTAKVMSQVCDVCSLFGSPCIGARLFFCDMPADQSTWHALMLQVRDGVGLDRNTRTAARGIKYDYELVPPGVRFPMEIMLDNPQDFEVGLVLRGLQLYNDGFAFLGGKTSRGTGRVQITVNEITDLDPVKFLQGDTTNYRQIFTDGDWAVWLDQLAKHLDVDTQQTSTNSSAGKGNTNG